MEYVWLPRPSSHPRTTGWSKGLEVTFVSALLQLACKAQNFSSFGRPAGSSPRKLQRVDRPPEHEGWVIHEFGRIISVSIDTYEPAACGRRLQQPKHEFCFEDLDQLLNDRHRQFVEQLMGYEWPCFLNAHSCERSERRTDKPTASMAAVSPRAWAAWKSKCLAAAPVCFTPWCERVINAVNR